MDNMAYMNNNGAGVNTSTPVSVTPVNEDYMNAQGDAEQAVQPTVNETVSPDVQVEPVRVKPYTFRKLNSTDLFPMIKIISKIGLDELTSILEGDALRAVVDKFKVDKNADEKSKSGSEFLVGLNVSLKLVNKILQNLPSCEVEIYSLLGNVSGMDVEAVKSLDIDIFMEMLLDFVCKEEFKSFFKVASRYINK